MSFNNKVDYIPNQPFSVLPQDTSDTEHKQFQKHRWQVLVGVFLALMIVANAIIWTQPATYQSQAILHFSYASQTEKEFSALAQQQITLHTQRLISNNVLTSVSEELIQNHGLTIDPQSLFDSVEAESSLTGRIITLKASGPEPDVLKPILEAWVNIYLGQLDSERQVNNTEDQEAAENQLRLLEEKIIEQKQQVEAFAQTNNITSLERDENRVLNKVKNVSASLDSAIAEQAEKKALLESVTESINKGESLIRPDDKAAINRTREKLRELSAGLKALSEKYTQAYLERDPVIVARQQNMIKLEALLEEQIQESQVNYLQEVQRDLQTAKNKVQALQEQLNEQSSLAQTFSQNLEEFKQLNTELKALQNQAQTIKTQQVAQEVSKPFEAKISLLESPFTPDFAIGPNYQLNSLIALIGSAVIAILALLLFSFIVKQKPPQSVSSNYVVIPGQNVNQDYANLAHQQQDQLSHAKPQSLSQLTSPPAQQRLLNDNECQALFAVANSQGKALIGLVLCGVALDELSTVKKDNFHDEYSNIELTGVAARLLPLPSYLVDVCRELSEKVTNEQVIWANLDPEQDFAQILVNAGHDAKLSFPEQVSLHTLRHTYLTYLVNQGVKLNDIEHIAGYTSPSDLAQYRHVNSHAELSDLKDINTQYPLVNEI